jgi:hypothetical protein
MNSRRALDSAARLDKLAQFGLNLGQFRRAKAGQLGDDLGGAHANQL